MSATTRPAEKRQENLTKQKNDVQLHSLISFKVYTPRWSQSMGIPMQQAHAARVKHIHVACAWECYYVLLVLADLQIDGNYIIPQI